ncbi:hypothetical protein R3P38DRAFT_2813589 [Favolaschia claudopus]|uniref:Uncharacterized protein n=1 Tax=Favolaschia claudopus TaxID=2862362 RepID=A0AAV9Z506_9AGAR
MTHERLNPRIPSSGQCRTESGKLDTIYAARAHSAHRKLFNDNQSGCEKPLAGSIRSLNPLPLACDEIIKPASACHAEFGKPFRPGDRSRDEPCFIRWLGWDGLVWMCWDLLGCLRTDEDKETED